MSYTNLSREDALSLYQMQTYKTKSGTKVSILPATNFTVLSYVYPGKMFMDLSWLRDSYLDYCVDKCVEEHCQKLTAVVYFETHSFIIRKNISPSFVIYS